MMNPQFMPPGQNNNPPSNPQGFPPISQEHNGVQNANYNPSNGPQMQPQFHHGKSFNPADMSQKMQNMNLNGPHIPSSQLPPGGPMPTHMNFPPTSNFDPGQLPVGQRPTSFPTSQAQAQISNMPQKQAQMPAPGLIPNSQPQAFSHMPQSNQQPNLGIDQQNRSFRQGSPASIPTQMPQLQQVPKQPTSQPSQILMGPPLGQIPPPNSSGPAQIPSNSQPGLTQQSGPIGGLPPQQISQSQPQQPGLPQQSVPSKGPQSGMPPPPPPISQNNQQQSLPIQPGMPPPVGQLHQPQSNFVQSGQIQGQPGLTPQSGPPGLPSQQTGQNIQPQSVQRPGLPGAAQQGHLHSQPDFQPHPGQIPGSLGQPGLSRPLGQPGIPPQPSPLRQNQGPGLPPHPGQPHVPQHSGHTGLPPQHGFAPQTQVPGQPGFMQSGIPPQPGLGPQPGMPPSSQYNQMQGLPFMPPPLSQQSQQYPSTPPINQQPGMKPPGPPTSAYPGMPPMPNQPMQTQPMGQGYGQPPSGYPPQYQPQFPGQQPSYPGQPAYQGQQKRLDPDQMPSPIQVMNDDQQNRGGVFVTNEKGAVPPLVTTDFVVDDKGNASPRYIRSSMYSIPVTADLLKQTAMPFCLVISPMAETVGAELQPPLLDFAALTGSPTMGPVRCSRCKAYMCPNMKFIDAGRHFKCAFCKATTEVPMEYTQYVNSMQQYGRVPAEMALGTYEIVATKEYCRNNTLPNPPAVVFLIDVSYNAIKSGLVKTVCENIMEIIESMPKDEQTGQCWTRVGFITYSSTVHFYNIKGTLAQPQMMSVGDVGDMFVPLLEGFLVLANESGPVLQQLLQQLPVMFADNRETETVLLPAVQAGLEALKAADSSGQLIAFHTTLPTYNAPGKLVQREDRKLLGTDKEKQVLSPQTTAYNEVGQACSAAGVSVELFVCNNAYVDAATIGQLPRLTGGHLHKYTYFTAEVDGSRLVADVCRVCSRATAHDAVMRVRSSTGIRATDFFGHLFMSNTTDVELAAIDADKAIGIELKHDDKLTGEDGVYIQAALLYTHRSGQRRLRVINLALNVAHQLADVYRSVDTDTCINFLTKQAVWSLREHSPRAIREGLTSRCARSLAAYRKHCATPSSSGQLVLPESMKLLPLYTSCLLRSDAIAGGPDITCDDRSCAMYRALTADVATSLVHTYPRLLALHTLAPSAPPTQLRATVDKMTDHGVYLLENGVHMLIWVGSLAPPEFLRDVFNVESAAQIDSQVWELPHLDNASSIAVRAVVDDARHRRRTAMRLTIMRQHDKLEAVLRHFLVEDRGVDGSASYVDFLCHVHKEIRAML